MNFDFTREKLEGNHIDLIGHINYNRIRKHDREESNMENLMGKTKQELYKELRYVSRKMKEITESDYCPGWGGFNFWEDYANNIIDILKAKSRNGVLTKTDSINVSRYLERKMDTEEWIKKQLG